MTLNVEGLETEVAGVKMATPIGFGAVVAQGWYGKKNPEDWARMLLRTVEAGSGQVTIATISYMEPEERKKLDKLVREEKEEYKVPAWQKRKPSIFPKTDNSKLHMTSPYGLDGCGMELFIPGIRMDGARLEEWKKEAMSILKDKLPENVPIIGSVTGFGSLPEGWLPSVRAAEEWGADIIELNPTCPIPFGFGEYIDWFVEKKWPARYPGAGLSAVPEVFEKIVKAAAEEVKVPIGVKLSADVGYPQVVVSARHYRDAGAKYITTMNATGTILPPDIYNHGKPITPHISGNTFLGVGGPALRIDNYKITAAIAKHAPGIDIIALGGITTPEHVVEFLMLGANATEQVTAVCLEGMRLFKKEIGFLKNFMKKQGYDSIKDMIGLHQKYLIPAELIYGTEEVKYLAVTDPAKCTGCGICTENPCCSGTYMEGKIAKVDPDRCEACGWCIQACPEKARKLVNVK